MNPLRLLLVPSLVLACAVAGVAADKVQPGERILLADGWLLQSSVLVPQGGERVSTVGYKPQQWLKTSVPSTVLNALVKHGVYPDPRIGMNAFRIPDSSDEFNRSNNLGRFSHLPDQRNPWRDPYWFRTEFELPKLSEGQHAWLNFDCLNYRADVWLNGVRIADRKSVVGMFRRFCFDVTTRVKTGKNALAVLIHPVDHPGVPDTQLQVYGKPRGYHKEIMRDVTEVMTVGYDCFPTVPDRNMGIIQDVFVEIAGPVDIRHPFVRTDLPLTALAPARLTISAELVNATNAPAEGTLRGVIKEQGARRAKGEFAVIVELAARETKTVTLDPSVFPWLVISRPKLWWPRNYGEQNLYELTLAFTMGGPPSCERKTTFGIRRIDRVLHKLDGAHGFRLLVNGQKIFCRGGYVQPEMMFDWDAERIETEIRYLAEANLNYIVFEDIPNPPDVLLDLCDRYGLMFWNCFYGCYWMQPNTKYPDDLALLETCTVDIVKRYRNHPSLMIYMAQNEGETREPVYEMWRRRVLELDNTRFLAPSGSFPDYRTNVPSWIKKDLPVGMNDYAPKSYGWQPPTTYYKWVREQRNWMFMIESGSASLPPFESLVSFMPELRQRPANESKDPLYPLDAHWAHRGANSYYKPYDEALRRLYGQPKDVRDYCWKGHLLTADQHRAFFEAVNHRMWDITSGFGEWKLNSAWPDIQWQLYDWYLRPMVSWFYVKKACAPLHVQLSPLDSTVTVINNRLEPVRALTVVARVFNLNAREIASKTATLDAPANAYRDAFVLPQPAASELTPVYFVKLELLQRDGQLAADNFYWLSANTGGDDTNAFIALQRLPPVELDVKADEVASNLSRERVARVRLKNPTDKLAFFIRLRLTKGATDDEALPIFWSDNYFSLLPGESKEALATFAVKNLGGATPTVQVDGWNENGVASPF